MPSASATPTRIATPAPTAPAPTAAPTASSAPSILDAAFSPNPVRGASATLLVKLSQPATWLRLDLYTKDMKILASQRFEGSFGPGWAQAPWTLPSLANGLYYAKLRAGNAFGETEYGKVVKLMILR